MAYIRGEESRVPDGRVIELDDWIQTVTLLNDGSVSFFFIRREDKMTSGL